MKTYFKRGISSILTSALLLTSIAPSYAAEPPVDDAEVFQDFLLSGMGAAQAVSELEEVSQVQFDTADYDSLNMNAAWLDDTDAFLTDYLNSTDIEQSYSDAATDVTLAEAKAISISYAIKCAEWSIAQNRGTNIAKESEYMFLSHYVDRKNYFWNQGKIEYLLDGETMSEYVSGGALAKWITDSDRQAYDNYMDVTQVSTAIQKVGNIALGYDSLKGNHQMLRDAQADMTAAQDIFIAARGRLTQLDSALTSVDVFQDFGWLLDQFKAEYSDDPNIKLSALFQRYMEDGNIFTDYAEDEKKTLVQSSLAVAGGYALGGCDTASDVALGSLKSAVIGFTIETYTDFFNYVAWLALQYGYSGRFALRLSDYLGL